MFVQQSPSEDILTKKTYYIFFAKLNSFLDLRIRQTPKNKKILPDPNK